MVEVIMAEAIMAEVIMEEVITEVGVEMEVAGVAMVEAEVVAVEMEEVVEEVAEETEVVVNNSFIHEIIYARNKTFATAMYSTGLWTMILTLIDKIKSKRM